MTSAQGTSSAAAAPSMPTEGVQKPEPVKTVESAASVLKERIDREIMERLEKLDQRLSALEKRLEASSREAERLEKGAEEEILPSPRLLGSADFDKIAKILEKGDASLGSVLNYLVVAEMLQNIRLNNLLYYERFSELLERRRRREEYERQSSVEQQFTKLIEIIEKRTGSQLSPQDIVSLVKEMWGAVKEVRSAVPVDEEKLVSRIVSEVEKRLPQGQGLSVKEALGLVRDTVESVKSIVAVAKELVPQQPSQASTTSVTPLTYQGAAPWYWHPDARVAIKEFVEAARSLGETVKDIILAIKAPETQLVKASKPAEAPKPSLPSELSLG